MSSITIAPPQSAPECQGQPTRSANDALDNSSRDLGGAFSFLCELRAALVSWDVFLESQKKARQAIFHRGLEIGDLVGTERRGPIAVWWDGPVAELVVNNATLTRRLTMRYDVELNRYQFSERTSSSMRETIWITRPYDLRRHVEWLVSPSAQETTVIGLRDSDQFDFASDVAAGMPLDFGPTIKAARSHNPLKLVSNIEVDPFDMLDG